MIYINISCIYLRELATYKSKNANRQSVSSRAKDVATRAQCRALHPELKPFLVENLLDISLLYFQMYRFYIEIICRLYFIRRVHAKNIVIE